MIQLNACCLICHSFGSHFASFPAHFQYPFANGWTGNKTWNEIERTSIISTPRKGDSNLMKYFFLEWLSRIHYAIQLRASCIYLKALGTFCLTCDLHAHNALQECVYPSALYTWNCMTQASKAALSSSVKTLCISYDFAVCDHYSDISRLPFCSDSAHQSHVYSHTTILLRLRPLVSFNQTSICSDPTYWYQSHVAWTATKDLWESEPNSDLSM